MGTASIKSGTINLLNTIVGAGILSMPFGLKSNGLLFGCILITCSALTSSFGLYLQNKVAKYTNQRGVVSFFSLSQLTYPNLSIVFDSAITIKCFGVGVSYLVVIGDLMPKIIESIGVVPHSVLLSRNLWISIFMFSLVAPLSYLKKLDSLKYTSLISLLTILYLICLVAGHYVSRDVPSDVNVEWIGPISLRATLASFPIFIFAYTCHQNMFAILNELKPHGTDGSQTRQANIIIFRAISTAFFSYMIVGIIGYLSFGDKVNGNVIALYPKGSISSLVGRLAIVIMMAFSYPLQCHPCRGSINHVIYFLQNGVESSKARNLNYSELSDSESTGINNDSTANDSLISTAPIEGSSDTDGHDPIIVPMTTKKFYAITTCINIFSYLIAISVTSLEHVLAFVGATGSTSISFILPGIFGYMLIKAEDDLPLTKLEKACKYGGIFLSIWGLLVMVVCLSSTLIMGAVH